MVLEYKASNDIYHLISMHAKEQLIINGAIKHSFKLSKLAPAR